MDSSVLRRHVSRHWNDLATLFPGIPIDSVSTIPLNSLELELQYLLKYKRGRHPLESACSDIVRLLMAFYLPRVGYCESLHDALSHSQCSIHESTYSDYMHGRTMLHDIALFCRDDDEHILNHINNYVHFLESKDRSGCTPLILAAWSGKYRIVSALLARNAHLAITSHDGLSPLTAAWASRCIAHCPTPISALSTSAIDAAVYKCGELSHHGLCGSGTAPSTPPPIVPNTAANAPANAPAATQDPPPTCSGLVHSTDHSRRIATCAHNLLLHTILRAVAATGDRTSPAGHSRYSREHMLTAGNIAEHAHVLATWLLWHATRWCRAQEDAALVAVLVDMGADMQGLGERWPCLFSRACSMDNEAMAMAILAFDALVHHVTAERERGRREERFEGRECEEKQVHVGARKVERGRYVKTLCMPGSDTGFSAENSPDERAPGEYVAVGVKFPRYTADLRQYSAWMSAQLATVPHETLILQYGIAKEILEQVGVWDSRSRTPLLMAIEAKFDTIARILVEIGADVHVRDSEGYSALMYTHTHSIARQLASARASVTAKTSWGESELQFACRQGRTEVVRVLLEANAPAGERRWDREKELREAAKEMDAGRVEALLCLGVDVDAPAKHRGMTALMYTMMVRKKNACSRSRRRVVDCLLAHGADIYHSDKTGMTALMHAVEQRCEEEVVEMLLRSGPRGWDAVFGPLPAAPHTDTLGANADSVGDICISENKRDAQVS